MNRFSYIATAFLISCLFISCEKGFLDAKPDKAILVPKTTIELQALLDNLNVFNISPNLHLIASDDLFITDIGWKAITSATERNSYVWASGDRYNGLTVSDWARPYEQIFFANVVLEEVDKIANEPLADIGRVKGTALFYRAFAYYNLAQLFTAPYNEETAAALPGLPLRTSPDINLRPGRGTLKELYTLILTDLKEAEQILPATGKYKSRPTRNAALSMLARVYLYMSNYAEAYNYADASLKTYNKLMDYNTLSKTSSRPFPVGLPNGNDEMIFFSSVIGYTYNINMTSQVQVDSEFYKSYHSTDLRKVIFFNATGKNFKGHYNNIIQPFAGLATDEIYLIRAECLARKGDFQGSVTDLNTLLLTRWEKNTFVPYTANDAESALRQVLVERRKELLVRGIRWSDLKRLNKDDRFKVTLERTIDGQKYTLPPNDPRYVFPIPLKEITLNGIEQNP
jgi:hypothetical protein